jgi:nitrogen fixation/metabolism regulation signal transduction histidine kinase
MATELRLGRTRAVEAERATALRESARQVAHELKNPLTPIRFAIARLRREAPDSLGETIDVLEVETKRLEEMARNFALFGRLPEGPRAPVDLGELVRARRGAWYRWRPPSSSTWRTTSRWCRGHVDALGRALTNVLLNAVEASAPGSPVEVSARRAPLNGRAMVEVAVRDKGVGNPHERLSRIWEPYFTHKPAAPVWDWRSCVRTLLAHDGAVAAEARRATERRSDSFSRWKRRVQWGKAC